MPLTSAFYKNMPKTLLFVGSPLLDITTSCDDNFLKKYNLKSDDCIRSRKNTLHSDLFVEVFENNSSVFTAGGSAQNSAKIAKWVLKNDQNVEVYFAGCVGEDEYAKVLQKTLEDNGVIPCYTKHETLPTGVCVCLVVSGDESERSMCTELGAAATYSSRDLENPDVKRAMENADIIFTTGYCLSHSLDAVEQLAEYCYSASKLFAISLSATYVCEYYYDDLLKWLPYIDIVFGNFEEGRTFVAKMEEMEPSTINSRICAQLIANLPRVKPEKSRIVIITNGTQPISVCSSGCEPKDYEIQQVCEVMDAIGCGDALAGGFLASYVVSECIEKAIKTGIMCATEIVKQTGCSIPNYSFNSN